MGFLVNPQLKGMGIDDLNQRYSTTFVEYEGRPVYIESFARAEGVTFVNYSEVLVGKGAVKPLKLGVFDWEKLNTFRPSSGWYYWETNGFYPTFHLSYPVIKQYKRGLDLRNICVYKPSDAANVDSASDYAVIPLLMNNEGFTQIFEEDLAKKKPIILRKDRVILSSEGAFSFYFGTRLIARILAEARELVFYENGFEQEVYEVGHFLRDFKPSYNIKSKVVREPLYFFSPPVEERRNGFLSLSDLGSIADLLVYIKAFEKDNIANFKVRQRPRSFDICRIELLGGHVFGGYVQDDEADIPEQTFYLRVNYGMRKRWYNWTGPFQNGLQYGLRFDEEVEEGCSFPYLNMDIFVP